jgi:hypothetical protein
MGKKSYSKSSDIINAIKRKVAVPLSQVTYSEQDILDFVSEELDSAIVPMVLGYHEEYFVFTEVKPLVSNELYYSIPERAIGGRLRDMFFLNSTNQRSEMVYINQDNRTKYSDNANSNGNIFRYTIEGNDIVIVSSTSEITLSGSLEMKYFLRPNRLVLDERAATAKFFVKTITIDNTDLVSGDILTIGNYDIEAGVDFVIGANSVISATNLTNYINSISIANANNGSVSTNIITLRYVNLDTEISSDSDGMVVQTTQGVEFDAVPENIVDGVKIDFLETRAGHRTYAISVEIPTGGVSGDIVNFTTVPAKFKIGDYICEEYECIIPQIPDDLHISLVERSCARILSALGDRDGKAEVDKKIGEMSQMEGKLVNNRVDGSPKKIVNTKSFVRFGKRRSGFNGRS